VASREPATRLGSHLRFVYHSHGGERWAAPGDLRRTAVVWRTGLDVSTACPCSRVRRPGKRRGAILNGTEGGRHEFLVRRIRKKLVVPVPAGCMKPPCLQMAGRFRS